MSQGSNCYFIILLALALLAAVPSGGAVAQVPDTQQAEPTAAKWFVLRQVETGYCHTALLTSVGGGHNSKFHLKAGGPYSTQVAALKERERLEAERICTKP